MSEDEIVIQAEALGKKFCRSLKRSLWYGFTDILKDLSPFHTQRGDRTRSDTLRTDEFWALREVSFQLKKGECLGVIGPNGAGKSTLLKVLSGILKPDTGRLIVRGRVCALIELGAGFNPILTGRENIFNRAALLGFTRSQVNKKFQEIVDFAEIGEFIDMPVRNYSSGMAVRLGFAVSSHLEPDILILDEVLAVGDVAFKKKSFNKITELIDKCAVILVSHSMPTIFRSCTDAILLRSGQQVPTEAGVGPVIHEHLRQSADNLDAAKLADYFAPAPECVVRSSLIEADRTTDSAVDGSAVSVDFQSSISIALHLKFNTDTECVVHAVAWNQELISVLDLTSRGEGFTIEGAANEMKIAILRIDALPLNSGTYNIIVHIHTSNGLLQQKHRVPQNLIVRPFTSSAAYCISTSTSLETQNHGKPGPLTA